jgi:hypothetical protein
MDHIPRIIIKTVNPENQRYSTSGDYLYDAEDDTLTIFVSRMVDWKSELAVAIHELFEAVTCLHDEVSFTDIDQFDFRFEQERAEGMHSEFAEPGDEKDAPYYSQHVGATFVEKEVCSRLGLSWLDHDKNVNDA